MSSQQPQEEAARTVVETNGQGVTGVFYWDPATGTEAMLIFMDDISLLPLEQRMWRAQWPMTTEDRKSVLDEFWPEPKTGITDETRRSVPWGAMHGAVRAFWGAADVAAIESFRPPSQSTIDFLTSWAVLPSGFRSTRDLAAHAAELRSVRAYLLAVYRDQSPKPAEQVALQEGITLARARNLIDRARQHGYLTRAEGGMGGQLTIKALDVSHEIEMTEMRVMSGDIKMGEQIP